MVAPRLDGPAFHCERRVLMAESPLIGPRSEFGLYRLRDAGVLVLEPPGVVAISGRLAEVAPIPHREDKRLDVASTLVVDREPSVEAIVVLIFFRLAPRLCNSRLQLVE